MFAALLARRRVHRDVFEWAVEFAVVGDWLAAEEFSQDLDALGQTGAAFVVGDVAGGVFARQKNTDLVTSVFF